jgi:hypothetical protein
MKTRDLDQYVRQVDDALATQELDQWQLHYNELADTLYIDFDEVAPYCVSSYLSGGWMVRIDREAGRVHGLQIENVLALEVQRFPFLLDLVLLTMPVGFTPSRVEQAARLRAAANPEPAIRSLRASLPLLVKSAA